MFENHVCDGQMNIFDLEENVGKPTLKIKVLGSGSKGNCYLLDYGEETLILDCGVPVKEVKKGLDFNISRVVGAICTHIHQDHSLCVKDFKNMGIPVFEGYKSYEDGRNTMHSKEFGSFKIKTFQLPHDDVLNCGFYITVADQKILYMTDFEYCKYRFTKQNIDHILIECNYQQELINTDLPQFYHKIKGHASLNTCRDFIDVNKSDNLKTVLLLHMGGDTCNAMECVEEIQNLVNSSVYVNYARKGLEVELR